jgi:hypothetical protein
MTWKPFDEAPKKAGVPIVVWIKHNGPAIVSWEPDTIYAKPIWTSWLEGQDYSLPCRYDITHWWDDGAISKGPA